METFLNVTLDLLNGFGTTVKLFALTLLFALPLGLIFSFFSMSKFKPLSALMKIFIWIIRGTPLMLQLIVVFYGPGLLFGAKGLDRFPAVLIAFVINYACYFSEIYRGGIESISRGQYEAGFVLGMTKSQVFKKIILKQVIQRIVPPMSNEIITLIKDTALANCIMVCEVIKQAKELAATKAMIWPLFYTGLFYLLFVGILTIILGKGEKKLSYFRS